MMNPNQRTRFASLMTFIISAQAFAAPATQPAWSTDIDTALHAAADQHRDTLIWFSGSGWNADSDAIAPALTSSAFIDKAGTTFVLVRADFAAGKQGQESGSDIDPQFTVWAERLGVSQLPALVAIDDAGKPYGTVIVPAGDASECVALLQTLVDEKVARDAGFVEARQLKDKPRAAALARGLSHAEPFIRDFYAGVVKEILALDPEDALGLKQKYAAVLSEATIDHVVQHEIYPLLDKGRFDEVIKRIDKLIADAQPTKDQQQLLVAFKGQAAYSNGDQSLAVRFLDEALALDPASSVADRIKKAKDQITETPAVTPATE